MAGILNLGNLSDGLRPEDFESKDIEMMWGSMLSNIDPQNPELSTVVATSILNLAPTCKFYFSDT